VPRTVIDRTVGLVARRCSVPADLGPITELGTEKGDDEVAGLIWEKVEAVYRSGMHPGIQLCIRHRGDVVVDRAIGHARGNLPGRRFDKVVAVPMTLETPINLFSAAKAVTGMVMHKLEEQGALSLDDRVADHLPGFDRHGKHDITLRHVLTHRAGIAAMPGEAFDLDLLIDSEQVDELLRDLEPSGPPGGPPAYHAVTGGFVMDAVVRRATGRSLREVLVTEIKEPLGLEWLDFGVDDERVEHVAQNVETGFPLGFAIGGFMKRALGKEWGPVLRMSNDDRFLTGVIPSGNVIVTARDIAVFYQCLMNGGEIDGTRVFDDATVAKAVEAEQADIEIDRMLGLPMRYSSGFMLGSETVSLFGWNHPRAFGHVGMSNLFTWADPDRDLVVALLTTGKPVLGTHMVSLVQLITAIHEAFPAGSGSQK
jgi:CubicO group peptidase (beta-lactamase class C family)